MSEPSQPVDTYAACLTPAGAGAIATIALWGPRAWDVVRELFQSRARTSPKLPAAAETGRIWLGRLGEAVSEEVVLSVRRTEPAPLVEVHCHGGPEVVRLLLETFAARGVRRSAWQDLDRWITGDRLRSLAAAALVRAHTVRTAAILLDQYQGAFNAAVVATLAAWDRGDLGECGRLLERLARHARLGRHLTTPWSVVVAGAPNVGKSSLVNALAGYPRCVVAATPGTTRDLVTTLIAVEGWPLEVADTAGLREQSGELEQQGIDLARTAARAADLCLWVLDASAPPVWPAFPLDTLRLVVNKVDLPAAWDLHEASNAVRISARTGAGLAELCQALAHGLVPEPPPPGAAVPFTPALCEQVEEAERSFAAQRLDEARRVLESVRVSGG
jgi:tRNA modification GTPase